MCCSWEAGRYKAVSWHVGKLTACREADRYEAVSWHVGKSGRTHRTILTTLLGFLYKHYIGKYNV